MIQYNYHYKLAHSKPSSTFASRHDKSYVITDVDMLHKIHECIPITANNHLLLADAYIKSMCIRFASRDSFYIDYTFTLDSCINNVEFDSIYMSSERVDMSTNSEISVTGIFTKTLHMLDKNAIVTILRNSVRRICAERRIIIDKMLDEYDAKFGQITVVSMTNNISYANAVNSCAVDMKFGIISNMQIRPIAIPMYIDYYKCKLEKNASCKNNICNNTYTTKDLEQYREYLITRLTIATKNEQYLTDYEPQILVLTFEYFLLLRKLIENKTIDFINSRELIDSVANKCDTIIEKRCIADIYNFTAKRAVKRAVKTVSTKTEDAAETD